MVKHSNNTKWCTLKRSQPCASHVAQLVRASSPYAGVPTSIPGQGTYKNQPMNPGWVAQLVSHPDMPRLWVQSPAWDIQEATNEHINK